MAGIPAGNARVRIKGRKSSVFRFFSISVAYTILWIILTSELGYYSKKFGPQVLLQLNLAYYIPSIPVLILSGQIEKVLDDQFGQMPSMLIRLTTGLLGCAAICASFPFLPSTLGWLLWTTALLGAVAAVAFSTSYQLVAWFRSADTIALGIGCVGSGPLVLAMHIALGMVGQPKQWQWIALFEIGAAFVVLGMMSSLSIFWQYWNILTGREKYDSSSRIMRQASQRQAAQRQASLAQDQEQPLLDDAEGVDDDGTDTGSESSWGLGWDDDDGDDASPRARPANQYITPRMLSFVGPFQGILWTPPGLLLPAPSLPRPHPAVLRRAASFESERSLASLRQFRAPGSAALARSKSLGQHAFGSRHSQQLQLPSAQQQWQHFNLDSTSLLDDTLLRLAADSSTRPKAGGSASAGPKLQTVQSDSFAAAAHNWGGRQQRDTASTSQHQPGSPRSSRSPPRKHHHHHHDAAAQPRTPSPYTQSQLDSTGNSSSGSLQLMASPRGSGAATPPQQLAARAYRTASPVLEEPAAEKQQAARVAAGSISAFRAASPVPEEPAAEKQQQEEGAQQQQAVVVVEEEMTLMQESIQVFKCLWTVVTGALISSTILNLLFPFFTYVPGSGHMGDLLPQALFYARIFSDISGRFLPRRKALALQNPYVLFTLALIQLLLATFFLLYIRLLTALVNDWVSCALVVVLWVLGGYVNTNSYILAPGMVPASSAGRASAMMALTYQIAHFLGLIIALVLAWVMYGEAGGIA